MDKKTIESQLAAVVLLRVGSRAATVTCDSRFDDLGIDSLDLMELLFEAEEEYGVRFTDRAARAFVTVGDVVAYIAGKRASAVIAWMPAGACPGAGAG